MYGLRDWTNGPSHAGGLQWLAYPCGNQPQKLREVDRHAKLFARTVVRKLGKCSLS